MVIYHGDISERLDASISHLLERAEETIDNQILTAYQAKYVESVIVDLSDLVAGISEAGQDALVRYLQMKYEDDDSGISNGWAVYRLPLPGLQVLFAVHR